MTKIDEATLAAKVPKLAARREAEALFLAQVLAEKELSDAEEALPDTPEVTAAQARYEASQAAISAAYTERDNARNALYEARDAVKPDPSLQPWRAAAQVATDAYDDHPLTIEEDYDAEDGIARCAASGLPLLDSDELLEDEDTGQKVLRCLVLPPRAAELDEFEHNETEAVDQPDDEVAA